MNKRESKKKMNTYLKFALLLLASACVGGVLGAASEMSAGIGINAAIANMMKGALRFIRENTLLLESVCGILCIILCEMDIHKMKSYGHQLEVAEDEKYAELEYRMEVAGCRGTSVSTIGIILLILFLAPGYTAEYIRSMADEGLRIYLYLAELVVFMGMTAYLSVWQVRYVKLIQKLYPEKKGDPTSIKFQEQWLASCDEAERDCIYQASYKTYVLLGKVIPVCTFIAMISHMIWNTGILAIVFCAVIWLLLVLNYSRCCVVKKREQFLK